MSIAELNAEIEKGAVVRDDGTLEVIAPTESEPTKPPEEAKTEPTPPATEKPDDTPAKIEEPTVEVFAAVDEGPQKMNVVPFVFGAIAVVIIASAFVAIKRRKAYQARLNEDEVNEE